MYICITESLYYSAEINTTLQINYIVFFKKEMQKVIFLLKEFLNMILSEIVLIIKPINNNAKQYAQKKKLVAEEIVLSKNLKKLIWWGESIIY